MAKKKLITRILYYYELEFFFDKTYKKKKSVEDFFKMIKRITTSKATYRYQSFRDHLVVVNNISIHSDKKIVTGKVRCVRKDLLPELMNTDTDIAKGIDAAKNEGILETTHFRLDYSKKKPILCLEHNQHGSKIGDFLLYLDRLGIRRKMITEIAHYPIVNDELKDYKKRMGECSEFTVKVHYNNLQEVKTLDNALWQAMSAAIKHFDSEYALLTMKFDWRTKKERSEIRKTVDNLINGLINKKEKASLFNTLKVKAEDSAKLNRLETFDLLIDKVRSEVKIEKRERYRTIVSLDIFNKMEVEMTKKFHHYK